MNISYNWLIDLIDLDLSPDETAKALTRVGLAVEGVHPHIEDYVFDVDLTSNRPDCLSHLGVARELGVSLNAPLTAPAAPAEMPMPPVLAHDIVRNEAADLCYRFTARVIRNVRVGPSPEWMVHRLEAIGERSINNVADITNYVMHELGQPMHAFDLDKLSGNQIIVRRAKDGESITTLDEIEHKLDATVLAICDAEKPVAVGGVMGGLDSAISDTTVNVLLEVAYFKPQNIRATSRMLGLATEASYRFERGVDIDNLVRASNRAADLICELAGGQKDEFIDLYPTAVEQKNVSSGDISGAVTRLTGLSVPTDECLRILDALGIRTDDKTTFTVPSWRHDIAIEEDLVEEVARHAGYENIAEVLPPAFGAGEYQPGESRKKSVRAALTALGYDEAISYSFIDTKSDGIYASIPGLVTETIAEPFVTLQDSVIEAAVRMRPTALPGILAATRLNLNHQRRDVKLFEIGKVFASSAGEAEMPVEREILATLATGGVTFEGKATPARELDLYDLKGAIDAALAAAGVHAEYSADDTIKHLRRGQSASITVAGTPVGTLGRLSDTVAASYKFKQRVFVAEIDLDAIIAAMPETPVYRPLAKFPAVTRDVTFVVGRNTGLNEIIRAVDRKNAPLCRNVEYVDVFEGKGLGSDERAITIRFEYRDDDRTLNEQEVEAEHQQILNGIEQNLGIKPRS